MKANGSVYRANGRHARDPVFVCDFMRLFIYENLFQRKSVSFNSTKKNSEVVISSIFFNTYLCLIRAAGVSERYSELFP